MNPTAPSPAHAHARRPTRRRRRQRRAEAAAPAPPRAAAEREDEDVPADSWEEARERARAKARVSREILEYAIVVGLLWLFLKPVAWVVGICWGIGLARKTIRHLVEPTLRERWIDQEVHRQLRHEVPQARRAAEGEQSRRIEEIAAGVAHEIRNPITAAKSLVQQMGEDPASAENVGYAQIAIDELNRVEKSISHLLRFARGEEVQFGEMSIADVIASAVETFRDRIDRTRAEVTTDVHLEGRMRGDAEQLRRVIINLLGNALDAMEQAGVERPRLEIRAGENLAGTEVWVRVRDNGPGIDPERLRRIFSPFYTSKDDGTGLGLAISKKVVDAHGGSIEAHSEPGAGTSFLLTLPKAGQADAEEERS